MTYFPANPGWERQRKSENKNYRSDHFQPDPKQRIEKKIAKKFKILKNTIIASFKAKTGWERLRKSENKNYRFDHFLPNPEQRIPKKIAKKFKQLKKHHYGILPSRTWLGKAERESK